MGYSSRSRRRFHKAAHRTSSDDRIRAFLFLGPRRCSLAPTVPLSTPFGPREFDQPIASASSSRAAPFPITRRKPFLSTPHLGKRGSLPGKLTGLHLTGDRNRRTLFPQRVFPPWVSHDFSHIGAPLWCEPEGELNAQFPSSQTLPRNLAP